MVKKTKKTKTTKTLSKKTSSKKTPAKASSKKARTKPPKAKKPPTNYAARDYNAARKLLNQAPAPTNADSDGAVVGGTDPCACGYAPEEHGHDADHPSWTGCVEGDCAAYEADPGSSD